MLTTYTSLGTIHGHNRYPPRPTRPFLAEILLHLTREWGREPWVVRKQAEHLSPAAAVAHRLNQSWPWPPTLPVRVDQEPNLL